MASLSWLVVIIFSDICLYRCVRHCQTKHLSMLMGQFGNKMGPLPIHSKAGKMANCPSLSTAAIWGQSMSLSRECHVVQWDNTLTWLQQGLYVDNKKRERTLLSAHRCQELGTSILQNSQKTLGVGAVSLLSRRGPEEYSSLRRVCCQVYYGGGGNPNAER